MTCWMRSWSHPRLNENAPRTFLGHLCPGQGTGATDTAEEAKGSLTLSPSPREKSWAGAWPLSGLGWLCTSGCFAGNVAGNSLLHDGEAAVCKSSFKRCNYFDGDDVGIGILKLCGIK